MVLYIIEKYVSQKGNGKMSEKISIYGVAYNNVTLDEAAALCEELMLEEKNHILSMISMYDELTKLLNRRGFMEKALHMMGQNKGKKACMVFADVDHLKEINDSFGHAAGDFAIITAANYLRENLPKDAVIARLGGDEYVALFVAEACCKEQAVFNIKSYAKQFNKDSDKPFYVEMSVGAYEFVCDGSSELGELFKKSDAVLYEEKQNRRPSVKKE